MGEKPATRDISKWATNGMLGVALLGGTPYVVSQQRELQMTHDTVIRLEEQNKALTEQVRRIEIEQQRLHELLERLYHDKKVAINLGPQPAGE